jgi:hypothetical protein
MAATAKKICIWLFLEVFCCIQVFWDVAACVEGNSMPIVSFGAFETNQNPLQKFDFGNINHFR